MVDEARLSALTKVLFVQPPGVEDQIFPWGVWSLADYLRASNVPADPELWLVRDDPRQARLRKQYRPLAERLFRALKARARRSFDFNSSTDGVAVLLTVLPVLGSDFLTIGGRRGVLRPTLLGAEVARELDAFKHDFFALLDDDLSRRTAGVDPRRLVFGISVYDRTLFVCLAIARRLRERFPNAALILGGDYFVFENARELVASCDWLDGVVVGYGEEVVVRLVAAHRDGHALRDIELQGFVNARALARKEPTAPIFAEKKHLKLIGRPEVSLQVVNVPPSYQEMPRHSPIEYVRRDLVGGSVDDTLTLRVLMQRGCSFGQCTFCTHIDKKLHFLINPDHVFDALERELISLRVEHLSTGKPIYLSFDADEHPADSVIDILRFFASDRVPSDVPIRVGLWFQVKLLTEELSEALGRFLKPNVRIEFEMNFESLNPHSLRLMRKGHTPLKAIENAKILLDTGHHFLTNYMIHFPMETAESVAEENLYLRSSLHLLGGRVLMFPYEINSRDDVYRNAAEFRIRPRRLDTDFWVREAFGFDMESSFWAYDYDHEVDPRDVDRWLVWLWNHGLKARAARQWWKIGSLAPAFVGASALSGRGSFLARWRLFEALRRTDGELPGATYRSEIQQVGGNWVLFKNYDANGRRIDMRRELSHLELDVLRFLYRTRKIDELTLRFADRASPAELARLCDEHHELGALARFRDSVLCTANDPAYWRVSSYREGRGSPEGRRAARQDEMTAAGE